MIKVLTSFLFISLAIDCVAQDYHFKQYRVEDGLPSDIIKGCTQDSLGFFWIATDDGLAKYDGIKFTTYREPLHSGYVKGFFHSKKNGRLFAFGDLDFLEIRNLVIPLSSVPYSWRHDPLPTAHFPIPKQFMRIVTVTYGSASLNRLLNFTEIISSDLNLISTTDPLNSCVRFHFLKISEKI